MASHSLRFHAGATTDFEEAVSAYVSESETAAARFVDTIERAVEEILREPLRFPLVSRRHRRAVVRPFPFSIVYLQTDQEIVIIAVAHAKRRPFYWRKRKP